MEFLKKTILQALTTGTTITGGTIIIPDLSVNYHLKIGLTQDVQDIGFFDTTTEYSYYPYGGSDPIGGLNLLE